MRKNRMLRKSIVGLGIIMGTVALFAGSSFADVMCYSGTITRVGTNPILDTNPGTTTSYYVRVDCDKDSGTWAGEKEFVLNNSLGEGGYATLLTAYSLDNKVRISVSGTTWDSLLNLVDMVK